MCLRFVVIELKEQQNLQQQQQQQQLFDDANESCS